MERWGAWVLVLGIAGSATAHPARAEETCAAAGAPAEVAAVLDELDLALGDGRVVRLAGLDPARATADRPELAAGAKAAFDHFLAGRAIRVEPLAATPDRWDRLPALVGVDDAGVATGGAAAPTLNETLIGAGWARARPESLPRNCGSQFRLAEARARTGGIGLWADPYYAVVSAGDTDGLARRTGAMAIVQGVVSVRHDRYRAIVSFGPRIGRDLVVVVTRQNEKRLAKAGLDLQKLVGREVRIRGFLDDRFGPRIDLVDPAQIEIVGPADQSRGAAPTSGMGSPDQNP